MMSPPPQCSACQQAVSSKNPMLACSGSCGQSFHFSCVKLSLELKEHLRSTPGLGWRCSACRRSPHHLDMRLSDKIEEMTKLFMGGLNSLRDSFLSELKSISADMGRGFEGVKLPPSVSVDGTERHSYASVAAPRSQSRVVVKPKGKDQPSRITKSTILSRADPVKLGIKISDVQLTRDGGLILGCDSAGDSERLMSAASGELSDDYEVKLIGNILSGVRIVGLSENYSAETVTHYLKAQNEQLFTDSSILKVTGVHPVKKNNLSFYASLKVDTSLYHKLLQSRHVIVGLDSCSIYDAFSLTRCYSCNEFNHIAAKCPLKDAPVCGKCAQNHNVKHCTVTDKEVCCSNCLKYNLKTKGNLHTNHMVWEYSKCGTYSVMLEKAKNKLYGPPAGK